MFYLKQKIKQPMGEKKGAWKIKYNLASTFFFTSK